MHTHPTNVQLYIKTQVEYKITVHLSERADREAIIFLGVCAFKTWFDTHDLAEQMPKLLAV